MIISEITHLNAPERRENRQCENQPRKARQRLTKNYVTYSFNLNFKGKIFK